MNGNNIDFSGNALKGLDLHILYEDNHIIAINKQPSQIVQGDRTGDMPLSEIVKKYIGEKYSKPGDVFLGVVHRLDRPVSGAVLFAKTSKALTRLNEMLRKREIRKTYWAVVRNPPPKEEERLLHYLIRVEAKNKSFAVEEGTKNAQPAELHYRLIGNSKTYSLLEIDLITGRHHQIRAQLAAIGCPIKGDLKYGFPRSNPGGFIHLHARRIEFVHPVSKMNISLLAPHPDDPVWNSFTQLIP